MAHDEHDHDDHHGHKDWSGLHSIPKIPPRSVRTLTPEEMEKHQVPIPYRDYCAALWVAVRQCQAKEGYWPWACRDEIDGYKDCEYEEYSRRLRAYYQREADKLKAKMAAETGSQ
eukprot:TRINITY_DN1829_c0_g1::TRINITY_DN1829_c0_g1_i1::g.14079::m.14079 TRINITY_DN1829_c0_g1::TRINITY_DN1829_c0_g1_i1::g.14079  ORF type:complete len:127 (+),score=16.10,sp/Q54V61/NDUB7_DICDI/35.06/6e-11,NDUF_B7/PF05676.8/4.3e-20,Cmc1/PF08583.5/0.053 TRINITY_DN1829_c0_g1_i1:39-383(+)